jgi:hypothetical protein
MKQPRLAVMLAVLVGLLVLRWWVPAGGSSLATTVVVVPATARPAARTAQRAPMPDLLTASASDLSAGTRDAEDGRARNAFAVRAPPVPPQPKTLPALAPPAPRPFVGPPLPPPVVPPPPPPLQVVGSWHDERGASVFVAGPRGVLQGRVGDVLLSDYRVVSITPSQVMVLQLSINQQFPLAVPAGALAPTVAAR